MSRSAPFWKTAIAFCTLTSASVVQAETLYERDGIELRGTARIVTNEVAACDEGPVVFHTLKRNHGQPLHIWQLDFSVHNGSGRPLQHIVAHFNIRSKLPPCSNWHGPRVRASSSERVFWGQDLPGPVFWGDSLEVLEDSNIERGAELRGTVLVLVFHEHRPTFANLSVNFELGEQASATGLETVAKAGRPADSADEKSLTLDRTDESTLGFSADQTCIEQPDAPCWRELENQPQCYVWDDYEEGAAAIMSWSGECSGGLAHGEGTLTSDWVGTDRAGFVHRSKEVSEGQLQNGKKHGHWSTDFTSEAGGEWYGRNSSRGPYVNGTRHGQWYLHSRLSGMGDRVSYVDGKKHGPWSRSMASGSGVRGTYLADKKHGHWYYAYDDGGGPNKKAEIVVYVKGEPEIERNGLGPSDWIDHLSW